MVRQLWWHVTCSMLLQLRCRVYSQVFANISYQLLASPPCLAMLFCMQQCEVACVTFILLVGSPCIAYAMHLPCMCLLILTAATLYQ